MRRSSLFAILAVGLSAQPVPQLSNSILDILPGGVLDNVSGLLGHSLDHPHHKNSTVPQCTLDSHLCIATCAPDCLGSTRAVSRFLIVNKITSCIVSPCPDYTPVRGATKDSQILPTQSLHEGNSFADLVAMFKCLKCMTKCNQETGCDDEDEGDSKDGKDGKEGP